jgi:hypothetical protein
MGDRIQSLIASRNRTRSATTKKITNQSLSLLVSDGENPDVIRDLLRQERAGRLDAGIDAERLLRIARFFGVTPTFLRTGRDDMDEINRTASPFPVGIGQPVISVTGGMGGGGFAGETAVEIGGISYQADDVRGEVILPDFMLASLSHSARRTGVHWFDVAGDSMEPTLRGGDWIGVNIEDKRIGQGGIFALRDHSGTIVVKRLEYSDQPGRIDIISDNPRQHSKTELVGDITVIGRVIARITKVG